MVSFNTPLSSLVSVLWISFSQILKASGNFAYSLKKSLEALRLNPIMSLWQISPELLKDVLIDTLLGSMAVSRHQKIAGVPLTSL